MRLVTLLALVVISTGCNEGEAKAPSDLVKKLEALEAEACACKDLPCTDKVADKVTRLGEANKDFDRDDLEKLQAIQRKLDQCVAQRNPTIVAYLDLAKASCACKDKACGQKVADKIAKWASELKASGKKLRASDGNVAMAEGKRAGECLTKLGVPIPR